MPEVPAVRAWPLLLSLALQLGAAAGAPQPWHCAPCSAERLALCPPVPASCPEATRPAGCGCCPTCALPLGAACGVATARCARGLSCRALPGEPRPLHALTRGQGACMPAPSAEATGTTISHPLGSLSWGEQGRGSPKPAAHGSFRPKPLRRKDFRSSRGTPVFHGPSGGPLGEGRTCTAWWASWEGSPALLGSPRTPRYPDMRQEEVMGVPRAVGCHSRRPWPSSLPVDRLSGKPAVGAPACGPPGKCLECPL